MKITSKKITSFLLLLVGFGTSLFALPPMNMPYGVTPVSHDMYHLHMATFYICCAIGAVVFSVMGYTLFKFRHSKGAVPAKFHHNVKVEIIWTVIPFVILVIMAVPATMVLNRIHDTKTPDVNIKITGYQWRWKYEYLDNNIAFFSDLSTPQAELKNTEIKDKNYLLEVNHPMIVPIKEKIRFLVTSNDVIHSWWVPSLGVKQDAVPGYINETWAYIDKPGIYRGQCAELCGTLHGFMPIVVKAVPQKVYQQWVTAQENHKTAMLASSLTGPVAIHNLFQQVSGNTSDKPLDKKTLMSLGKKIYTTTCSACHQPDGKGVHPVFPSLVDSKIVTGDPSHQIDIVLHGIKGSAMQGFAQQLDNTDIAAVITYERNAWGNGQVKSKYPKVIQPKDIAKARTKKDTNKQT